MAAAHVYLIPAFFGFVQLGYLSHFNRVCDILGTVLKSWRCAYRDLDEPDAWERIADTIAGNRR